jgi:hypothetical protein
MRILAAKIFSAARDHSLRLKRLGIRSQAHELRICLQFALHPYPGTTTAR